MKVKKTHLKVLGEDFRYAGQTENEYHNQALCGYAGLPTTTNLELVDCKLCLSKINKEERPLQIY